MSSTLARRPDAAPIARTPAKGFTAIEFVCPCCGGRRWGTSYGRGHCNDCSFSWDRALDWTWFRRLDGTMFHNAAALASVVEGRARRLCTHPPFCDFCAWCGAGTERQ